MKASVEPLEGNKVKLSVEVDEQEFEKALNDAFKRIAREVRIPGFRPGKAPRRLLESHLGKDVARQEALREALPEYFAQAVEQTDIDVIAPPEIDITSGESEGPVAFDAVVEVRPNISVPGYGGLRVTVPNPNPTDEDINNQIDRLRRNDGELKPVNRPARDGDHVTIDRKIYRHDEVLQEATDELYEVGSGTMTDELDQNLRGAKVGDILKFNAKVGDADEDEISFQVLVKDVKEMELPELTDEWASDASEFETVDELKADLRNRLSMVRKVQTQMALRDEVVKALVELVEEEVPEPLISAEMERRFHDLGHRLEAQGANIEQYLQATGQSQDALLADVRESATSAVKADLALRAVADAEDLQATEEDVDNEIARLAERLNQKAAQVRRQLERGDQMPAVRSDVRKAKALEWLLEHVEVVDEEGHPIDRADLKMPDVAPAEEPEEQEQQQP
jgi:trigger factor